MGDDSTREPKICEVCGDRALGYNFNAISCESCKAFFRRNALKNKDFRCPFSENCSVTPVTRRFCQKCRLEKCLSVGMRKEYIMTEEDKVLKRQKIEQNRAKKRPPSETPKTIKMKREIIEEEHSYDDTSASVASTTSDVYLWESEQKYAEMESKGESSSRVEGMSPVTTASVPSPSSPESRNIIGSKTLDMLKELPTNGHNPSLPRPIPSPDLSIEPLQLPNHLESTSTSCPSNSCKQIPKNLHCYNASGTDSNAKGSIIIEKLQSPGVIAKLMKSPYLLAEIFKDKSLLAKIADNPKISEIIEEIEGEREAIDGELLNQQCLINNGVSDDLIRNMLDANQSPESPSLVNLIGELGKQDDEKDELASSESQGSDKDVTKDIMQDVERIPIAANSIESILCQAIKLEFSAYSSLGGNQSGRELNDAERAKLNELIVANKALLAPLDDELTNLVGEEYALDETARQPSGVLLDLINLTAIAIRRLIKMSKKINAFKNMCQEDQLALLKGGCTEMMILRSALTYDPEKEVWKIPHSQDSMSKIKTDVLKQASVKLYAEHTRFVNDFDSKWRDENIILILSAIALFTPDRPRVVHTDVIKLEQNSYYYLLRRYLESIYPGCEAKSMFLRLIRKISQLHRLNKEVVGVYLNVNPSSVEPLLIEIFDLKN